jgi:xanthine dehydrogenase accessory factor
MRSSLLAELDAESGARHASILVTDIESGAQRLVRDSKIDNDPLAPLLAAQLRLGKSGLVEAEGMAPIFLHVRVPPLRMFVVGAVHIAQALVPIAVLADYDLIVVDPRTAFATPERFPDCELIAEWPQQVFSTRSLDRYTALVALSHIPEIDDEALKAALAADCFYIGALGSRRTHAKRLERLRAQRVPDAALARIHAPIGLDIGAVGASEIAISILAEVIAERRQKPPRSDQAA